MNFGEFEKANKKQLRAAAKHCFELSKSDTLPEDSRVAQLLEAQFYLSEIERRGNSRTSLRDLLLEIVVIALIGFEIILAIKQGKDEDILMGKQNGILTSLQQSTAATASTMQGLLTVTGAMDRSAAATASTLGHLEKTTEIMNNGVHDQIALFYDPAVILLYSSSDKKLQVNNTGRTSFVVDSISIWNQPQEKMNRVVAPNSGYYWDVTPLYDNVEANLTKGTTETIPVVVDIHTEDQKHYVVTSQLFAYWDKNSLTFTTQTASVTLVKAP